MGIVHPFTIPGNRGDGLQASAAGTSVGPYKLISMLGRGGMSTVWLAERVDGGLGRRVALKLSDSPVAEFNNAQRFLRERDILARLEHPHIARLYDAGVTEDGRPWLALEYVEGLCLAGWCDEQRLTLRDRVKLFREVLEAVQYAHAALIIHRDIKPANIMVTREGAVRLLDFGIAKLLKVDSVEAHATMLTQMAGHAMTMAYASPEQLREEPLTTATDIYSLGVVLYELLTGVMPYKTKLRSAAQLEQAIINGDVTAPSRCAFEGAAAETRQSNSKQLKKIMNRDLDAIVLKAMRTDRSRRYETAAAMLADLDRWLANEPVQARRPSAWDHASKFVRRHPWGTGLGTAAVCGLIAASVTAGMMAVQARQQAAKAEVSRDFLLGLFKDADPDLSKGQELKARDLLAAGAKKLELGMMDQPELKADLLKQIAMIYGQFGQNEEAVELFSQRTALLSSLRDQETLIESLIDESELLIRLGRLDDAELRLQRVDLFKSVLVKNKQLSARCALMTGWLLEKKGRHEAALEKFQDAASQVNGSDELQIALLTGLAQTAQQLGKHQMAIDALTQIERIAERLPSMTPSQLLALRYTKLRARFVAGEYAGGWAEVQKLLNDSQEVFGTGNPRLARYRQLWILWSSQVGESDKAAEWVERNRTGSEVTNSRGRDREDWPRLFARISIDRQQWTQAAADINFGQQLAAGSPSSLFALSLLRVECLLRQNRASEALAELNGLNDSGHFLDGKNISLLLGFQSLKGVALGQLGHLQLSVEAWEEAVKSGQKVQGASHTKTALAQLQLAAAIMRFSQDDTSLQRARQLLQYASPNLNKGLPTKHPARLAIHDLSELCEALLNNGASRNDSLAGSQWLKTTSRFFT